MTASLDIELCGRLADACGRFVAIPVPAAGLAAGALVPAIARAFPALAEPLGRGRIRACVNDIIVSDAQLVRPGDRVALFPPVSGG